MPNNYIPIKVKKLIKERAKNCCEYCRSQVDFSPQIFLIKHIIPLAKNGTNDPQNLALACQGCNNLKGVKTEDEDYFTRNIAPLFNPRIQIWEEHFEWNKDYSLIIGQTDIGRATVDLLQLNRFGVVNLRKALHQFGEHPLQI
ncbi:MAG: hypothetical protein ACI9LN_001429 [Saprospiraceae bacterium]|jgi:hypothetical protein